MKKINSDSPKFYIAAICIFSVFLFLIVLTFFECVNRRVDENSKALIIQNLNQKNNEFHRIIQIRYENLEGLASYIGGKESLNTQDNQQFLQSIAASGNFYRIHIMDKEGSAYLSDGSVKDVSDEEYFKQSMNGSRAVADSVISGIDNTKRLILSVPIKRQGQVVGVLGGSCDVQQLGDLIFQDLYEGQGYYMIVSNEGKVILTNEENEEQTEGGDFFSDFKNITSAEGKTADVIRNNFANHVSDCIKMGEGTNTRYLAYSALDYSNWMLCYVVGVKDAQQSYSFIIQFESVLAGLLMIGVIVLLYSIWKINQQRHKSLIKKAHFDSLTKLVNKEQTEIEINEWMLKKECRGCQALLMIDLDEFKDINDTYGHQSGDEVLKRFAQFLKSEFRQQDIIGRIGGDEFIVFVKNIPRETIMEHLQHLQDRLKAVQIKEIHNHYVTCSIGVAYAPADGKDFGTLYRCADIALYRVKQKERGGYEFYS